MEMQLWHILVLAVVQGIAEFLPISSSGHVVIMAELLAPSGAEDFDVVDVNIVLHVGTLLSILVFYWQRVVRLIAKDRRTIGLLIVGTIPAVVIGVPVELLKTGLLESPLLSGALLIVTGAILIWVSRHPYGDGDYRDLSHFKAFLIGGSQAAALLPGLSRSGATISAGLGLGLSPSAAATFPAPGVGSHSTQASSPPGRRPSDRPGTCRPNLMALINAPPSAGGANR